MNSDELFFKTKGIIVGRIISKRITTTIKRNVMIDTTSLKKASAFGLDSTRRAEKIGTKDEFKAPSAKIRLKKLGNLMAITKASIIMLVPM